jgi:hypothetical protein
MNAKAFTAEGAKDAEKETRDCLQSLFASSQVKRP